MYSLILATMVTAGAEAPSHWFGCHGCHGCVGVNAFSGAYGWGGCYGCGGCYGSCYGCSGCWGSCYGGCWGGCYGGCWGSCAGCIGYYTYQGCIGCNGCVGTKAAGQTMPKADKGDESKKAPEEARRVGPPAPAQVTIVLPEGARLFVNDQPITVDPAARTFNTPDLNPGQAYHYIFRAEMPRDGQMMRDVQRVEVAAGRHVTVEFKGLPTVAIRR